MATLRLKCIEGPLAGQTFELARKDTHTIGRQDDCDIALQSPRVSRRHAEILCYGEHLFIRDLNSQNGTFLNDRKIESQNLGLAVQINSTDRLSLGDFVFELESTGSVSGLKGESRPNLARMAPSSVTNPPEFFPIIADLILEIFVVERLCLMGFDAEQKTLFPLYFADAGSKGKGASFEPSAMVLHQLMNEKKTIFTVNAAADTRFNEGKSIVDAGVRAIICAPVLKDGKLHGGIYVDALHQNHQLSPKHQAWLESFAALLGQIL